MEVLSWTGSDYDWVAQEVPSAVFQYTNAGMTEYEYTASANQTTFLAQTQILQLYCMKQGLLWYS